MKISKNLPADSEWYYDVYSTEYIKKVDSVDPSEFLSPLVDLLPSGSLVFDVGCGTGRDLLWMKNRGYLIMGLDRSMSLLAYASEKLNQSLIHGDFETFDFSGYKVDCLLMVSALVHVPHERFVSTFSRILRCLKEFGLIYLSLKEGCGVEQGEKGRVFHLWNQSDLEDYFDQLKLIVRDFGRIKSLIGKKETYLSYVLQKSF